MRGRPLQVYAVAVSVALFALVAWTVQQAIRERQDRDAWTARLGAEQKAREHALDQLRGKTAEVARLGQALAQARAVLAQTADATNPFEDAVGIWLDQVSRLGTFLGQHPEFSIPELRYLTANDWLDATRGANLVTEADYREALANLRSAAKRSVAPRIRDALQRYVTAHNGALPPDAPALSAYLPDSLDPAILQRYTINPSGRVPGLIGDQRFVLVESKPVDELWDSAYYFSATGAYGLHGAYNAAAAAIRDAINRFEQNSGGPPTAVSQIEPYLQRKISAPQLAATFNALTTKPNIPADDGAKR